MSDNDQNQPPQPPPTGFASFARYQFPYSTANGSGAAPGPAFFPDGGNAFPNRTPFPPPLVSIHSPFYTASVPSQTGNLQHHNQMQSMFPGSSQTNQPAPQRSSQARSVPSGSGLPSLQGARPVPILPEPVTSMRPMLPAPETLVNNRRTSTTAQTRTVPPSFSRLTLAEIRAANARSANVRPSSPPRPWYTTSGGARALGSAPLDPHGVLARESRGRRHTPNQPTSSHTQDNDNSSAARLRGYLRRSNTYSAGGRNPVTTASISTASQRALIVTDEVPSQQQVPSSSPSSTATTGLIPVEGQLYSLLVSSLRECHGYDAVATFTSTHYPHLVQQCQLVPRFLHPNGGSFLHPPDPLTLSAVITRVQTYVSERLVRALRPPDWEGYMVFALEVKWLETGLVVCGFGGDIIETIWRQGSDRRGSGDDGRYTEDDVRRKLGTALWWQVERRFRFNN